MTGRLAGPGHAHADAPQRPSRPSKDPVHPLVVYATEETMLDKVVQFLRPALADGSAGALVVATPPHIEALRERLGPVPCTFLDAQKTLDTFVVGDRIDADLFDATVGEAVRTAGGRGRGRLRAFGEMVALLCEQGRPALAFDLEALWNRLTDRCGLELLCAYPATVFQGPSGLASLAAVCAQHDVVLSVAGVQDTGSLQTRMGDSLGQLAERARREVEGSLVRRERQQACIARIGHMALRPGSLDEFFDIVCREVTQVTGADASSLMQLSGDGTLLHFRSGVGYPADFHAVAPVEPGTHGHFILRSGAAVVYNDLRTEQRFRPAPHLLAHGVVSGMSIPVLTSSGPWGTIGLHCHQAHEFTPDDVNFLQAVSHVFGSAIERRQAQEDLERSRERLEALVRERTARLEQANRELDAFSSAVSHDLRGPVRAISGFSALLAQQHAGRLDPRGRELLDEVRRAATRMGDLIEDLLDLSRADRALPNRVPVDLSALALEILDGEAAHAPTRQVTFDVEPGIVVQGDPDLLRVAMENLLSNAWKFTLRSPDARISVSKRREGEDLVLCVQDNGAGFDMADAGRLFQPFQRLHRRSEYDGTGIGLATVRRIIERHGGRIWAQSRPGSGASFYFTLPGLDPATRPAG